jgi:hypothetical protein
MGQWDREDERDPTKSVAAAFEMLECVNLSYCIQINDYYNRKAKNGETVLGWRVQIGGENGWIGIHEEIQVAICLAVVKIEEPEA